MLPKYLTQLYRSIISSIHLSQLSHKNLVQVSQRNSQKTQAKTSQISQTISSFKFLKKITTCINSKVLSEKSQLKLGSKSVYKIQPKKLILLHSNLSDKHLKNITIKCLKNCFPPNSLTNQSIKNLNQIHSTSPTGKTPTQISQCKSSFKIHEPQKCLYQKTHSNASCNYVNEIFLKYLSKTS